MTIRTLGGAVAALALGLSTPGFAQNADAPVDVTAAPPPSAETVGPSQLRDFNLKGTVTRPSDRPVTTDAQPARPAITTSAPPATGQGPNATGQSPNATGSRAIAAPRASASPQGEQPSRIATTRPESPVTTGAAPPAAPLDATSEAPPATPYDGAPVAAPISSPAPGGSLPWPWIAALLALVAGGAFIGWSRRGRYADPGRMAFASPVPDAAPDAGAGSQWDTRIKSSPEPQAAGPERAPVPAAKPAPQQPKKNDGLIVSTGLKPQISLQFQPDRAVVTENDVLVQFDVLLVNSGSAQARDVLIEGKLVCAHAGQDQEIVAFFQNPVGQGDRIASIPPMGQVALKSAVRLPIAQLRSFEAGGRKLFVPLVAFNILFRSNAGDEHASASFLVGRGSEEDQKLAPFRLDLGPRIFRGLSARAHSLGLKQVA